MSRCCDGVAACMSFWLSIVKRIDNPFQQQISLRPGSSHQYVALESKAQLATRTINVVPDEKNKEPDILACVQEEQCATVLCSVILPVLEWSDSTSAARIARSCTAAHRELYSECRLILTHVIVKARTAQVWAKKVSDVHVQFLELRPCGRVALSAALEQLPNLHRLRWIKCKGQTLRPTDCRILAGAAVKLGSVMRMVNIESCQVNDEGACAFADTGSLETLCIRLNSITDTGVASLTSLLPYRTLQVLNLKGNRITDIGVETLGEALSKCSQIRLLNLRNNMVACSGASALARAIGSPDCSIKVLRLRSNLIRDTGTLALCCVLEKLHELDLDMNKLTESGKSALKVALLAAQAVGLHPVVFPVPVGQIAFPRQLSMEEPLSRIEKPGSGTLLVPHHGFYRS